MPPVEQDERAPRSCNSCGHHSLCFLRHNFWDVIRGQRMINVDGGEAPGKMNDIFDAVGRACLEYEFREEK